MPSSRTILRAVSVLGLLAGAVHILLPDLLLGTARIGYDRVLAVDFEPREAATRRVRLLGVAFLTVGLAAAAVGRRG